MQTSTTKLSAHPSTFNDSVSLKVRLSRKMLKGEHSALLCPVPLRKSHGRVNVGLFTAIRQSPRWGHLS